MASSYQTAPELIRGLDQAMLNLSFCLLLHVGLHVILHQVDCELDALFERVVIIAVSLFKGE